MKQVTKAVIEDMLCDYYKADAFVNKELQAWRGETETLKLLTIDEDSRINSLKHHCDVIRACLNEAGNATVTIITALYFEQTPNCTLDTLIADGSLNISRRMAHRLRDCFLRQVANGLLLVD